MINPKVVFQILGFLLLIETAMLLCCGAVSFSYKENDLQSFLISSTITVCIGFLLLAIGRDAVKSLNRRDGYVIVSATRVTFSFFGMLPYYIGGYIPNVADASFETMSGFSSTSATIPNNIESMPYGILFRQTMMQQIGSLGIIPFTIAVLPIFGVDGIQVFAAKASGPARDKVHPRIGITAKWIWGIYAGMTGTLTILLISSGMSIFDSVCHAFTTTSADGFSTKRASIEYYHSPYVDYVVSVFMFLSDINFTLLLLIFNGKIKKFLHDAELKFYFIRVSFFTLFIAI